MGPSITVVIKGVPGLEDSAQVAQLPGRVSLAWFLGHILSQAAEDTLAEGKTRPHNVIVTLDGRYVPAAELDSTILEDGARVEIMPLLVGG